MQAKADLQKTESAAGTYAAISRHVAEACALRLNANELMGSAEGRRSDATSLLQKAKELSKELDATQGLVQVLGDSGKSSDAQVLTAAVLKLSRQVVAANTDADTILSEARKLLEDSKNISEQAGVEGQLAHLLHQLLALVCAASTILHC